LWVFLGFWVLGCVFFFCWWGWGFFFFFFFFWLLFFFGLCFVWCVVCVGLCRFVVIEVIFPCHVEYFFLCPLLDLVTGPTQHGSCTTILWASVLGRRQSLPFLAGFILFSFLQMRKFPRSSRQGPQPKDRRRKVCPKFPLLPRPYFRIPFLLREMRFVKVLSVPDPYFMIPPLRPLGGGRKKCGRQPFWATPHPITLFRNSLSR